MKWHCTGSILWFSSLYFDRKKRRGEFRKQVRKDRKTFGDEIEEKKLAMND